MHFFYVYIGLGIIGLIGLMVIYGNYAEKREEVERGRQWKEFNQLAEKAIAGEGPERKRLTAGVVTSYGYTDFPQAFADFPLIANYNEPLKLLGKLRAVLDGEDEYAKHFPAIKRSHEIYAAATKVDRIKAYGDLVAKLRRLVRGGNIYYAAQKALSFDVEVARSEVASIFREECDRLATLAIDDFEAFEQLRELIDDYKSVVDGSYPDTWNQLVATHVELPSLHDFGIDLGNHYGSYGSPKGSEIRLMAARALEQGDYVEAKLVLAYVDSHLKQYAEAVGETMVSELARMIVRHDRAHAKITKVSEA